MKDYNGKTPSCELEKELFEQVENNTPDYIKADSLFDINNENFVIHTTGDTFNAKFVIKRIKQSICLTN